MANMANSNSFLHHSNLGMVLVSKFLDGDNYSTWHRAKVISWMQNWNWVLLMELSRHFLQRRPV